MKRTALMLALAALTAPATAQSSAPAANSGIPVETARGEFSQFPQLKRKNIPYDYNRLIAWTSKILSDGQCKLKGQRAEKFDIDVPYAMYVEPDGSVRKIMVQDLGCAPLETMIGSSIVEMVQRGEIKPTGQAQGLWYGDRFAFARY